MTDPYQPYQPPGSNPPPPDPYTPPAPDPYAPAGYYQQPAPAPYLPPPVNPYGYPPPQQTEGLAIASLVVSCAAVLGLCFYGFGAILGIVGAILGHVARKRIARDGSGGAGMALAGIIVGWIVTALVGLGVAAIVIYAVAGGNFS
ncbi:hypothetical protein BJ973_007812 [Actinoplanes tereljensis]|uniref:DUF4190 domain-containing protein n=1 Tax=Paractinoplanes tereljensis TaxID=571912 RepID=A0A919TV35_9ACTN|nr:DUF4190 domain-containing protein [Actinoplanes tereljensis]GIF24333.1 hypothetical protein Ate02nite_70630 [Actinoplanes tereljensis]